MPFSREEQERLLAAATNSDRVAILVGLRAGLRRSEVLGLRWKDVDLEGGYIRVRQRLSRGRIGPPKTKRSRRNVPLTHELRRALREWKLACPSSEIVFPGRDGYQSERSFSSRFKEALKTAGVTPKTRIPFHRCRHTFASELIALGEPIPNVSKWLGHSNPSFTLDVYGHYLPRVDEHRAVSRLDSANQDSFRTVRGKAVEPVA